MLATPAAPPIAHVACAPKYAHEQCGYLTVPLDRRHPNGRTIRIYFERYLRKDTSRPATSTVVSIEGGPGYSTTIDRDSRLQVWRPVSQRRDLLLIDLRGTGKSGAIMCPAFVHHALDYDNRAGRCAQQLGPDRDFYSTSQAVQDMQAVMSALHVGKVDMYGDSYGSYTAQAFALRYPHRLRSLVLDGTYPLPSTDPLLSDLAAASRKGLRLVCRRGPNCPVKGQDPVAVLHRFVVRVRAHPISGMTVDGDGTPVHVTVDEDALVQTVMWEEADPNVFRTLLGAVLSAEHGDNAPILRLVASSITVDGPNGSPRAFSEALYLAVTCHDYIQPWSPTTPMAARLAVAMGRIDARPAWQFAPFSNRAWTGTDYEGALSCLKWPSPAFPDPPAPPHAVYPHTPTLILNGDLDNITPLADARIVASRFPNSRLVVVTNTVHVTVLSDNTNCASLIYERFVRTLNPGNTSCAAHLPETRVVGRYPLSLGAVAPARSLAGDHSTVRDRRMVSAAASMVADSIGEWWNNYSGTDVGLRGGHWSYSGGNTTTFRYRKASFVPGVPVTGKARWNYTTGAVSASVTVSSGGTTEHLTMTWTLIKPHAQATITGTANGRTLRARMLAP